MTTDRTYTLDELCTLTETPKRTVRYYMQIGLVSRPEGINKGAKYYARHLEQLLAIRKWQDSGLSLDRIRELLVQPDADAPPLKARHAGTVEVWSHLVVAPGVELHIEPGQANLSPEQVRALFRAVMQIHTTIQKGENNE
jgi:DNA-binding transcriptional MerR regulator